MLHFIVAAHENDPWFHLLFLGAVARVNAAFGQGSTSSPIFLDSVRCNGLEIRLLDCQNRGLEVHSCTHSQDAGVSCIPGMLMIQACCAIDQELRIPEGCTTGEIRLVGGVNFTEGRVEICLSDEWGTVCDQMWDDVDASIVCRQLHLASAGI